MKFLIWISGVVFFLGVACATFLIVDAENATRFLESWPKFPRGADGKPGPVENVVHLLKTNWLFYALVAVTAGLAWAGLVRKRAAARSFRRLQARAVEKARTFTSPPPPPAAPAPAAHSAPPAAALAAASIERSLAQLEVNWKTFASYTQDLLQRKLKDLDEAPQKAARETTAHLAVLGGAIEGLRQEIVAAKKEWKDAAVATGERLARTLEAVRSTEKAEKTDKSSRAMAHLETLTRKLEEGIKAARDHFSHTDGRAAHLVELIEGERQNVIEKLRAREIERLQGEWGGKIAAMTAEIEGGKRERERLVGAIARAAQTEADLRGELDRAASRDAEYQRRLSEAAAHHEKQVHALKSLSQEGEAVRKEMDRKAKEAESERRTLAGKVEELESQGTLLESERESAIAEIERLEGVIKSRDGELGGLRTAVQSLRDEKARLEGESRRLGEELKTVLAGRAAVDKKRGQAMEAETTRLREELETLRRASEAANGPQPEGAIETVRAELAAARAELATAATREERATVEVRTLREELAKVEKEAARPKEAPAGGAQREAKSPPAEVLKNFRLELERVERERQAAAAKAQAAEEEMRRLREEVSSAEGVWLSRVTELERDLAETQEKLSEKETELAARRRQEPAAGRDSAAHTPSPNGDRLQELENEKQGLQASTDRLSAELERLRGDLDGFRRFQGALIEGSLPAAIAAVDADLKVFAWNPASEELWGKPAGEVLGRVLNELAIPGLQINVIEDLRGAMREKKAMALPPSTFVDRNGKTRHLRWSCDPILGPEGEAQGALLIADEATQEVEKEIEARLQAFFSQSLLRSLPAALVVLDTQHRVISWNQNAGALLGIDEETAAGADFFCLKTPLAKTAFQKRYEQNERDGGVHRVRALLSSSQGEPTYYTITQAPFVGNDGAVRGSMLLLQSTSNAVPAGQPS